MTHKAAIIGIGVPDVLLDVPFSPEKLSRYLADKVEAKQVSITDIYAQLFISSFFVRFRQHDLKGIDGRLQSSCGYHARCRGESKLERH